MQDRSSTKESAVFTFVNPSAQEVGAPHFQSLARTEMYGGRSYPGPEDYRRLVGELRGDDSCTRHYAAAQLNWHHRGQNGCLFAQMAAKKADTIGWEYLVDDEVSDTITRKQVEEICLQIEAAIQRPGTQMLSLLLPGVTNTHSAVHVMRRLAQWSDFWLERDVCIRSDNGNAQVMHLRYPVLGSSSWLVAFGPFAAANTRKAPFFELAVRVKPKPEGLRPELNQKEGEAHLADVVLPMPDEHFAHRMESTVAKTLRILGGMKDPQINAAKVTLYAYLDTKDGDVYAS